MYLFHTVDKTDIFGSKDAGMKLNCASCWNLLGKGREKSGKKQQRYLNKLLPLPTVHLPMPTTDSAF